MLGYRMDYKWLGMESMVYNCLLYHFIGCMCIFKSMNSITIKDKQYILVNSHKKATRCEDCDLHNHLCDCLCYTMATLCGLKSGTDCVFKGLKVEK